SDRRNDRTTRRRRPSVRASAAPPCTRSIEPCRRCPRGNTCRRAAEEDWATPSRRRAACPRLRSGTAPSLPVIVKTPCGVSRWSSSSLLRSALPVSVVRGGPHDLLRTAIRPGRLDIGEWSKRQPGGALVFAHDDLS